MRRQQSGFTLLEVIVAVTISAILVSLVYGSIRISSRSLEAAQTQIEDSDAMRIGWQFLQRALNGARIINDSVDESGGILFDGGNHKLSFVADMPGYLGLGGLYIITIEKRVELFQSKLLLSRIPLSEHGQTTTNYQPQTAVLVDDLKNIDIHYFGSLQQNTLPGWHSNWHKMERLPLLVKIQITPNKTSPWPLLIAHPQIGLGRKAQLYSLDGGGTTVNPLEGAQ